MQNPETYFIQLLLFGFIAYKIYYFFHPLAKSRTFTKFLKGDNKKLACRIYSKEMISANTMKLTLDLPSLDFVLGLPIGKLKFLVK